MVNVFAESIAKANIFPRVQPIDFNVGVDIQTFLSIQAWIKNLAYFKNVWVDMHIFDGDDAVLDAKSLALQYAGPACRDGDFFLLRGSIHQAGSAGPGWATAPWRDDRKVQYRLYYEVNGQVFTDGILHQFEVESSRSNGGYLEKQDSNSVLADLDARAASCKHYHS